MDESNLLGKVFLINKYWDTAEIIGFNRHTSMVFIEYKELRGGEYITKYSGKITEVSTQQLKKWVDSLDWRELFGETTTSTKVNKQPHLYLSEGV